MILPHPAPTRACIPPWGPTTFNSTPIKQSADLALLVLEICARFVAFQALYKLTQAVLGACYANTGVLVPIASLRRNCSISAHGRLPLFHRK